MKIYFTASMGGKKQYGTNYEGIVNVLKKMSYNVIADHILGITESDLIKESVQERKEHFKKVNHWIKEADIVVAEVSHPSTNVGYEISMALDNEKPVLALHVKDRVPVLLIGALSEKLALVSYDLETISDVLHEHIDELRNQMDVRFNFFIPPKIGAYLDWVAKHKKLPRAVFLRRLIEEHMRRNKEYKA